MSFGPLEIILIIVVIALVFGAKKLPELGKGLGQGIKEFKRETHHKDDVTDVPSRPLDPATATPVTPVSDPVSERR
ncbi:twin-arginine translocase TatA/TatE family subunit [Deinococcus xianganensis]|uniref:Sec-independent protein translocase protein TatA n=1 Tax=Deinococcus xianganensis TaxID=1507289 RepID=A0A6I4YG48_9DEIO|nr:twin-arginine translocase TatA/TatE family subunit [Deinococcus xianganensis]MXV18971.1 twin-arginine translocase TatA/TatE family subunit [Deinococcus xianganensis]